MVAKSKQCLLYPSPARIGHLGRLATYSTISTYPGFQHSIPLEPEFEVDYTKMPDEASLFGHNSNDGTCSALV